MLNQAKTLADIWCGVVDTQRSGSSRDGKRDPHALIRLRCGDIPLQIEDGDGAFLSDPTDEVHFADADRQGGWQSKAGRQSPDRSGKMQFGWRASIQGRMVLAAPIAGEEDCRMRAHGGKVG